MPPEARGQHHIYIFLMKAQIRNRITAAPHLVEARYLTARLLEQLQRELTWCDKRLDKAILTVQQC